MPDAIFTDARLALVYDEFEGDREDLLAYMDIADQLGAEVVVDIGCGTGTLAVLLARAGRAAVAIDPSEASLRIAKTKEAPPSITWVHGDATDVPETGADLAVMSGNVAQVFITDDE